MVGKCRPPRPPLPPSRAPLLLLLLLLLGARSCCCQARRVAFDNTQPMRDRAGHIMDAHDGSVQRFDADGPFYMHAVSYGLCEVRRQPTTVPRLDLT